MIFQKALDKGICGVSGRARIVQVIGFLLGLAACDTNLSHINQNRYGELTDKCRAEVAGTLFGEGTDPNHIPGGKGNKNCSRAEDLILYLQECLQDEQYNEAGVHITEPHECLPDGSGRAGISLKKACEEGSGAGIGCRRVLGGDDPANTSALMIFGFDAP